MTRISNKFNWKIASAAQTACILEVDAPKVGNVNRFHDFADTSLEDFHFSALAIGRPFGYLEGQGVGKTIYEAVKATREVVCTNTNLGIILLLAPLGMAWRRMMTRKELCPEDQRPKAVLSDRWKQEIKVVLNNLSVEDTRYVYQAIRLASPAGMGKVKEYDVYQDEYPQITLLEAMKPAAERDLIARQYLENFALVLEVGYEAMKLSLAQGLSIPQAIAHTHLFLLSRVEDSLISRKLGPEWSRQVQRRALLVWEQGGWLTGKGREHAKEFDSWLRQDGHNLNPGSTADLMAAILFVCLLENDGRIIEGVD